MDGTFC